jgi:hypothetical protein
MALMRTDLITDKEWLSLLLPLLLLLQLTITTAIFFGDGNGKTQAADHDTSPGLNVDIITESFN